MTGIDRALARRRGKKGIGKGANEGSRTLFVVAGHRYLFRRVESPEGTQIEISDQDGYRAVIQVPLAGREEFCKSFQDMVDRSRARLPEN